MSLVSIRKMTAAKLAANRRNALKSTGPRTEAGKRRVRMNALQHGLSDKSFCDAMPHLGEDVREYRRFRQGLTESLRPANVLEDKLVDDLARLWWKKARADRAETALQLQEMDHYVVGRLKEFHEINRETIDQSCEEVVEVGLLRARNCRGKFHKAIDYLDGLIDRLGRGVVADDEEKPLRSLYGRHPTVRGQMILSYYEKLLDGELFLPVSAGPATPNAGSEEGEPVPSPAIPVRDLLLDYLLEERTEVGQEYELFLREHVQVTDAARDARLAPTDARWTWILRMNNYLDRQIERKMKLLLSLQQLRRAQADSREWSHHQASSKMQKQSHDVVDPQARGQEKQSHNRRPLDARARTRGRGSGPDG